MTKNTRAIMPVHWSGLPCDMDHICDFAKEHGLEVVEDASHSHGATLQGRHMGSWGRMAGLSLQASKPLPAIEAGVGMYQNRLDYERASAYGHWDAAQRYSPDSPYRKYVTGLGTKLRIHPIAAILAKLQLKHLPERNAAGVAQVKRLNDRLTQLPGLSAPPVRSDCQRVYYNRNFLFLDEAQAGMSREACRKSLRAEDVHVGVYNGLGNLLHTYPVFQEAQWFGSSSVSWHQRRPPQVFPGWRVEQQVEQRAAQRGRVTGQIGAVCIRFDRLLGQLPKPKVDDAEAVVLAPERDRVAGLASGTDHAERGHVGRSLRDRLRVSERLAHVGLFTTLERWFVGGRRFLVVR